MHLSSLDDMRAFVDKFLQDKTNCSLKVLDLGSRQHGETYKQFFDCYGWDYLGVDVTPGENVDLILKDPYHWREIDSCSVDVVVSGQAFEHIEFFWLTMQEIARVLKPEGLCCIIAPSGGREHRYPVDCWRFYPDGFRALAKYSNLEVLEARTQGEPKGYSDDSDSWANSILVARKSSSLISDYPDSPAATDENYYECEGFDNLPKSLKKLAPWIEPESVVLELGTATGYFTQYMTESLRCTVDGVEVSKKMAEKAQPYCRTLCVADLDQIELLGRFKPGSYDYIVMGDVLEHLRNPGKTLESCRKLLKEGTGKLLLSVPNITYAGIIGELLNGNFKYRDDGLLDRTHIRFFSRRSLYELLKHHGLKVDAAETIEMLPEDSEFRDDLSHLPEPAKQALFAQPDALTYQFIVKASPGNLPDSKWDSFLKKEKPPLGEMRQKRDASLRDQVQVLEKNLVDVSAKKELAEKLSNEARSELKEMVPAFYHAEKLALDREQHIYRLNSAYEFCEKLALERMHDLQELHSKNESLQNLLLEKNREIMLLMKKLEIEQPVQEPEFKTLRQKPEIDLLRRKSRITQIHSKKKKNTH